MAKKNTPGTPPAVSLLPGFGHLVQGPRPAHYQLTSARCSCPTWCSKPCATSRSTPRSATWPTPISRNGVSDLKAGVLQQLNETQVEQDFNHVLLRALGYTTQSDVAAGQPWT